MKHISIGLMVASLLFTGSLAFAQTNLTDGDPSNDECISLQTSLLRFGSRDASTNGEVTVLQDFLISKGMLGGQTTGYYGRLTVNAVKVYQRSIGVSPTGNVGPLTKSILERETCSISTQSTNAPVSSVTAPGVATVATKPQTCVITTDKRIYTLGDKIFITYTSEGGNYASWIKDTSGKDNLYLSGDKLPTSGTSEVVASVVGNPSVTLGVYGPQTFGTCTKVIPVEYKPVTVSPSPVLLPTCSVSHQTIAVNTNPFTINWSSANTAYGVAPSGDKINTSGSATYQLSLGEEKTYSFTFYNSVGQSVTCSTLFSSIKG